MIAFISSTWFRGVSVKDQVDKFSKNGKKDSEVWKRLQLLQATVVARHLGVSSVKPFKEGTLNVKKKEKVDDKKKEEAGVKKDENIPVEEIVIDQ